MIVPAPARGASLAYFGRSALDSTSLSVTADIPLRVLVVHPSGTRAYGLSDDGRLWVLDTLTNTVVATVPVDFTPLGLTLNVDGRTLYVTGMTMPGSVSDARLLVIDTATNAGIARVDLGVVRSISRPFVHPAGAAIYVVRGDEIAVIDPVTAAVVAAIPLPVATSPELMLHPSGNFIYTSANPFGDPEALVIDTRLNAVVRTVALPGLSALGAVLPAGPEDARLFVFSLQFVVAPLIGSTAVFDAATGGRLATIPLGNRTGSVVADPASGTVYAALFTCTPSSCGRQRATGVAIIDGASLAVVGTLPAGEGDLGPSVLSIDSRDRRVYVRGTTRLSVIDTDTRSLAVSVPFLPEPQTAGVFGPGPAKVPGSRIFFRFASTPVAERWGEQGDRPVPADYDGDGRADVAVWRPRDEGIEGLWFVHRSTDGTAAVQQWGAAATGDLPVPADYDGDGRADFAVWRRMEIPQSEFDAPEQGVWYLIRSSDGTALRQQWGASGDRPVPADYDGDARADLAVWRAGLWYIVSSRDGSASAQSFGEASDVPVPADYDGDGRADLAVWRPATGEWWIVSSRDGAVTRVQWGAPGDVPVPADYDGDGRADLAVWRPATGEWWSIGSRDGGVTRLQWGAPGDVPVPADYDGDGLPDATVYRP